MATRNDREEGPRAVWVGLDDQSDANHLRNENGAAKNSKATKNLNPAARKPVFLQPQRLRLEIILIARGGI